MKNVIVFSILCAGLCLTGYGATNYVDCARPDDSGSGTSWATAKRTIQAAVNAVSAGDTVLVAPGIYSEGRTITPGGYLSNRVVVTKNILLQSRDGAAATVIQGARDPVDTTYQGCGSNAVRCVYMTAGTLRGFTLTGGASSSVNLQDVNSRGGGLYGLNSSVPLVYACIVSNNAAIRGGGAYMGTFYRCLVAGNYASGNGAGVRESKIYDCLIVNNIGNAVGYTRDNEGVVNCTIARNSGVALDNARAYNSIIIENAGGVGNSAELVINSCVSAVPTTSTNNIIVTDARFADSAKGDFRLLANSPCLDKASTNFFGTAGAASARTDYLGNARLQGAGLDMGAIEGAVPNLAAVFGEKQGAGSGSLTPTNRCLLTTFPTQVVFTATAAAGSALRHFTVNGAKMPDCGNTFTLTVTQPGSFAVAAVFYPARYVDAVSGSDANDGTTPATAWRTLQFAATNATDGSMVLAAPGVYNEGVAYGASNSNRVALTRNIVLKGSAGASQTVIMGSKDLVTGDANGRGPAAVRCIYLFTGSLEGFTLTGGATQSGETDGDPVRGGALYTVSSEIWDCVISNNVASRGSAAWGGNLHRCRIDNNLATGNGATRTASLYDSLIINNRGAWAVSFDCKLYNCTVCANANGGCGAPGMAYNSIVYGNSGTQIDNGVVCTNSCVGGSLRPGAGNISADPLFVDAANGNYRLRADSPCADTGNAAYGTGADGTDLSGASRVQNGQVNMGAYETCVGVVTASATSGGSLAPTGTFLLTNDLSFVATPWPDRAFRYFETNGTALADTGASLTLTAAAHSSEAIALRAVFQDGFYVDAVNGNDANSGLETNVPLKTLQTGVRLALAGDTVRVAPGTYSEGFAVLSGTGLASRIAITNAITVRSLQGAAKTLIVGARSLNANGCGSDAVRCVYMSTGTLQGFTLTGGATDIAGGSTGEDYGGGVSAVQNSSAQLIDCVISNNIAYTKGAGSSMATLHRCWIADNTIVVAGSGGYASGIRGGEAYDSVVVNNSGPSPIAYANLYGVTAVNTTPVQTSTAYNSILVRTTDGNSYTSSDTGRKVTSCCLTGALSADNNGGGNVFSDPLFINSAGLDFRLHVKSPCVNSGNSSWGPGRLGLDYAGATRIQGAQIDMGAYEGGLGGVLVHAGVDGGGTIDPSGTLYWGTFPVNQTFTAAPRPGRSFLYFSTNGVAIPNTGTAFTLTSATDTALTLTANFAGTLYADASRPDDSGNGVSWETAKRTLQAAVDLAVHNDTVLVAPGLYSEGTRATPTDISTNGYLNNRVVITNNITLRSRDGAASTIILGAFDTGSGHPYGLGPNAVRCVYLGSGTLQGFTLTGGATDKNDLQNENNRGGGVYVPDVNYSQLVLDCIISNNASVRGGGTHAGTVKRCVISDNYATNNSSGVRGSYAYHCLISNNRTGGSSTGSAAGYGWCFNCTLTGNEGRDGDSVAFYNCILTEPSINCRLYDCCIGGSDVAPVTNVNSFVAAPLFAKASARDYRLAAGSPCIDRANLASVDTPFGSDLDGALRMQNGRIDLGAYEWDWRPTFSSALDVQGLTVTNVTPFVTYSTNAVYKAGSAVYLDGAAARTNAQATVEMAARWAIPYGRTVTLNFRVTGNGTLALYEGATAIGTATAADGATALKYRAAQNPCALRFVYTPGTGDLGGAWLDGFKGTGGALVMLR